MDDEEDDNDEFLPDFETLSFNFLRAYLRKDLRPVAVEEDGTNIQQRILDLVGGKVVVLEGGEDRDLTEEEKELLGNMGRLSLGKEEETEESGKSESRRKTKEEESDEELPSSSTSTGDVSIFADDHDSFMEFDPVHPPKTDRPIEELLRDLASFKTEEKISTQLAIVVPEEYAKEKEMIFPDSMVTSSNVPKKVLLFAIQDIYNLQSRSEREIIPDRQIKEGGGDEMRMTRRIKKNMDPFNYCDASENELEQNIYMTGGPHPSGKYPCGVVFVLNDMRGRFLWDQKGEGELVGPPIRGTLSEVASDRPVAFNYQGYAEYRRIPRYVESVQHACFETLVNEMDRLGKDIRRQLLVWLHYEDENRLIPPKLYEKLMEYEVFMKKGFNKLLRSIYIVPVGKSFCNKVANIFGITFGGNAIYGIEGRPMGFLRNTRPKRDEEEKAPNDRGEYSYEYDYDYEDPYATSKRDLTIISPEIVTFEIKQKSNVVQQLIVRTNTIVINALDSIHSFEHEIIRTRPNPNPSVIELDPLPLEESLRREFEDINACLFLDTMDSLKQARGDAKFFKIMSYMRSKGAAHRIITLRGAKDLFRSTKDAKLGKLIQKYEEHLVELKKAIEKCDKLFLKIIKKLRRKTSRILSKILDDKFLERLPVMMEPTLFIVIRLFLEEVEEMVMYFEKRKFHIAEAHLSGQYGTEERHVKFFFGIMKGLCELGRRTEPITVKDMYNHYKDNPYTKPPGPWFRCIAAWLEIAGGYMQDRCTVKEDFEIMMTKTKSALYDRVG